MADSVTSPPSGESPAHDPGAEPGTLTPGGGSRFAAALATLERHRNHVRVALAVALLARLVLEFRLPWIITRSDLLVAILPTLGIALLGYLIVLWSLAVRTRDRFGFGMALGIGVVQATMHLIPLVIGGSKTPMFLVSAIAIALTHGAMAWTGIRASAAFPPESTKGPWVLGAVAALITVFILPAGAERVMTQRAATEAAARSAPLAVPTDSLRAFVARVHNCAERYAAQSPTVGYPPDLQELGPGGSKCLAAGNASGAGDGWSVIYTAGKPDSTGRTGTYRMTATQTAGAGRVGGSFESDETGSLRATRRR